MTDDGVSSVVAAVLIFSLMSTASLLWTLNELPDWIEGRESNHAATVQRSFGSMQAGAERLSANGDNGPFSQPLTLAASPIPFVQRGTAQGALSLRDGFAIEGTFTNPFLHVQGNGPAGPPNAPLSQSMASVDEVEHLFVRYTSSLAVPDDLAMVIMTAQDASNTVVVRIIQTDLTTGIYARTACLGIELRVSVTVGAATNDHVLVCDVAKSINGYTVNLLESRFNLESLLGDLDPGYAISWASGGSGDASASSYLGVWTDVAGATQVAGTGVASSYALDKSGASVVYQGRPLHHSQQDLVWEGGALVVAQAQGSAMAINPGLVIDEVGTQGFLRWTVVTLNGTGSVSGTGEGNVLVRHLGTTEIVLTADAADFTITTDQPAGWSRFFADAITAGGLNDVSTTSTATSTSLALETGAITSWTIHLRIIDLAVSVS